MCLCNVHERDIWWTIFNKHQTSQPNWVADDGVFGIYEWGRECIIAYLCTYAQQDTEIFWKV